MLRPYDLARTSPGQAHIPGVGAVQYGILTMHR